MAFIYAPMPSTQCSQCIRVATVQEALFNRIHMLEKQLYQAFTDRDAAYRTLLAQAPTTASSVKTSGSSTVNADPICLGPGGSPLSFATSSVPPHHSASQTPDKQHPPLIDLLGPIEQEPKPCFENFRSSFNPGIEGTDVQDSVDKAHSISPMSKSDLESRDPESNAYIRRFSGKLRQPKLAVKETARRAAITQPKNGTCEAKISDHTFLSSYFSNDADFERYSPKAEDASLNSSFTEYQELLDPAHNVIPTTSGWAPLHKMDRPQWAHSNALKALLAALSSEERWEKYCQSITVNVSGHHGDTCVYHTVMIYNLSVDCTMGNILDQVRGGMILDATMLDTTTITGSITVMLTFVESSAAVAFTEHVGRYGLSVHSCVARAFILQVPTARIKLGQIRAINSHFHSRCLRIHNLPLGVTLEKLRWDLQPYKPTSIDLVESMSMNADDVLELRFLSVTAAEDAFDLLTVRDVKAKYRQCRVVYGPDPCAESWLEEENAARSTESTPASNTNTHQSTKCQF